MTKYSPLTDFLSAYPDSRITLSFEQVEELIGSSLPASSANYEAHWRGRTPGRPGGAIAEAGWSVARIDQRGREVTLIRSGKPAARSPAPPVVATRTSASAMTAGGWQSFEERARRYFSGLWGVELRARDVTVGSGRKRFDLVSADQQIVGDAKSFSDARGASGKLSGIAEYVLFLQAVPARRRFLVFERRVVATEFLRRWRGVVTGVDFYLLEGDRHEVLHG